MCCGWTCGGGPTKLRMLLPVNVTDEELERILNEQLPRGWELEGIRFAMHESSKRPTMAFLFFTRIPD